MAVIVTGRRHLVQQSLPRQRFGDLKSLSYINRKWEKRKCLLWGMYEAQKNKLIHIDYMYQALRALELFTHLILTREKREKQITKKGREAPAWIPWTLGLGQGKQKHSAPSPLCIPRALQPLYTWIPNSPTSLLPSYLAMSFTIFILFLFLSLAQLESDSKLCFSNRFWYKLITWLLFVTLIPSRVFHLTIWRTIWCKSVKRKIIVYNQEMWAANISEL